MNIVIVLIFENILISFSCILGKIVTQSICIRLNNDAIIDFHYISKNTTNALTFISDESKKERI